jgi:hypothetical protein
MNKISAIMLIAGLAVLSACASDEASVKEDQTNEEMTTQQPAAVMPESTTQDKAMMDEEPEKTMPAETEEPAAEPKTSAASSSSGNLVSTCTNGGEKRVISVVYDNETTGAVCEVTYEKSSGVQTLWSANNERDYCLDKAKEFVEKQKGWGWTCSDLE